MNITVKILPKDDEENLGYSLPVDIEDFITNPSDIEFRWEEGSTLPYNDFIFFGNEYYYSIFIDDVNINKYQNKLNMAMGLLESLDDAGLLDDEYSFTTLQKLRGEYDE